MPEKGTVLVVESDPMERERMGKALGEAGYEVIACPGPIAPNYTCIGGREDYCPLLERADVVVLDPWLDGDEVGLGTTADELLALYAGAGRTVVTIDAGGSLDAVACGPVIRLGRRPNAGSLVAAVRTAPEVKGFVPRRHLA